MTGRYAALVRNSCIAGCVALTGGCTVIYVDQGRVARAGFGTVRIVPDEASGVIAYRSAGVGLVPTLRGATLGFGSETVAVVRDGSRCSVVVFALPEATESAALWKSILADHPDVCLLKGESHASK